MVINIYGNVYLDKCKNKQTKKVKKSNNEMEFKRKIKERDKVCQCCGESKKQLEVHHIFSKSKYPELSTNTGNGILLCQNCHNLYHREAKDDVNPKTFAEFKSGEFISKGYI